MKIGAVITFNEGIKVEQAEEIIAAINQKFAGTVLPISGELPQDAVDSMQVREYDPNIGEPVFYVP